MFWVESITAHQMLVLIQLAASELDHLFERWLDVIYQYWYWYWSSLLGVLRSCLNRTERCVPNLSLVFCANGQECVQLGGDFLQLQIRLNPLINV